MARAEALIALESLGEAFYRPTSYDQLDVLFDRLAAAYADSTEPEREEIRHALAGSQWATAGYWQPGKQSFYRRFIDARRLEDLRRALVLLSMANGGDDPRDTIAAVDDLTFFAQSDGVNAHDLLKEVAGMSSRKSMLGMTSMADLLDNRATRCAAEPAVAADGAPPRR
jgi:hypothetical protein